MREGFDKLADAPLTASAPGRKRRRCVFAVLASLAATMVALFALERPLRTWSNTVCRVVHLRTQHDRHCDRYGLGALRVKFGVARACFAPGSRVPVVHAPRANNFGFWMFAWPHNGTGVLFDVGRTLCFDDHESALAAAGVSAAQYSEMHEFFRSRGVRSLQYFNRYEDHRAWNCQNPTLVEIVDLLNFESDVCPSRGTAAYTRPDGGACACNATAATLNCA